MTARSLVLVALLAAAGAVAQEPTPTPRPRLGGGFGKRAGPTPTPTPNPVPASPLARPPAPRAAPPEAETPPEPRPVVVASPKPPPPRTPAPPQEPGRTSAAISVGYVVVPFVVTDRKGKPIPNLKQKDVTLLADDVPVAYDLFERSLDAPVSFTILLDGSGSMGLVGKMDGAKAAIRALLDKRVPGDDFSLHVFSAGEVREEVPFTEDAASVLRAVDAVVPWGRTAFYDALAKMPDRSLLGRNGSRALILLTDGVDNASTLTQDQLAALLEGVEVPVFPLGLRSAGVPIKRAPGVNPEQLLDLEILGHIARISGGRVAVVDEPEALARAILDIEADLRAQYVLGFTPTGKGPVRYWKLNLKLAGPARPVRVRAGYRGTAPPRRGADRTGGE